MFDLTHIHRHTASLSEVYGHPPRNCRFLPSCKLEFKSKGIRWMDPWMYRAAITDKTLLTAHAESGKIKKVSLPTFFRVELVFIQYIFELNIQYGRTQQPLK